MYGINFYKDEQTQPKFRKKKQLANDYMAPGLIQ